MNRDLISNNFSDNVNKNIIKRNIRLLLIIIILFSIYTVFNCAEYYTLIRNGPGTMRRTIFTFYSFTVRPWIYVISVIIGFIVWVNYIKGHKLILLSFENDQVDFFNEGYAFLNKAAIANIIGFTMLIVSAGARYFLKYF